MPLTPSADVARAFAQVRPILRSPRFWLSLICGGAALGIAGPFGTVSAVPLVPRMAYWVLMVLTTGVTGLILCRSLTTIFQSAGLPRRVASTFSGLVAGGPISLLVHGLNSLLLPPAAVSKGPVALTLALFAISILISVTVSEIFFARPGAAERATPLPPHPRLLDRLPSELQAPLLSLSAIDHYTEVMTEKGTTRLLLRLSDAIAEAAPTPGLRLHRSHWVARSAIVAARRDGPRAFVTLTDGSERPVSRGNMAGLEETGLLPPR
jgi:hypothetical protein